MDKTPSSPPQVSVIIPCHNAGRWLWDQLDALTRQVVPLPWEVIVVDNRSTDLSARIALGFSDKLPALRVLAANEGRGPAYARNTGAKHALGTYFLFFDADDVVAEGCVAAMVHALEKHALIGATHEYGRLNPEWTNFKDTQRDMTSGPYTEFLPFAGGGTIGIRRDIFFSVGGFDESMVSVGMEDCDFCWRVQLHGTPLHVAKDAVVHYRRRTTIRSLYKQEKSYGKGMMLLIRKYQKQGYNLQSKTWRGIALECVKLLARLPKVARSKGPFANWVGTWAFRLGMIAGSFIQLPAPENTAVDERISMVSEPVGQTKHRSHRT